MIAPCKCGNLAKWARDGDMPIIERDGEYVLGDGSIEDPRLIVRFCPFCGEHGWPHRGNRLCKCGVMESAVQDYPNFMEFDSEMNEFHIHSPKGGKLQIYYCIACGGNPPPSLRHTFFEEPTDSDYDEARAKISTLRDENDFIREFGEPAYVVDIPPPRARDIEIYGMKPIKKQWTFEPRGSRITYCLQLMADGTYRPSLSARHKKSKKSNESVDL